MEHAIFLREVHHAQEIRQKLLLNLMLSDVPDYGRALFLFDGRVSILLFDPSMYGQMKSSGPLKGTSLILHLEIDDVDVAFKRLVDAGATITEEISSCPGVNALERSRIPLDSYGVLLHPLRLLSRPKANLGLGLGLCILCNMYSLTLSTS